MSPRPRTAHPRVGGENQYWEVNDLLRDGSSPRGRGKHGQGHARYRSQGLIPAWAGKTDTNAMGPHAHQAHPRVGGENSIVVGMVREGMGSSPRGRGKQRSCPRARRLRLAHPRVGGENGYLVFVYAGDAGSSPRGRGKRLIAPAAKDSTRLIPAWAGKTFTLSRPGRATAAHPRVGGENLNAVAGGNKETGSSPRGRGKLNQSVSLTLTSGLIPAWAGKTWSGCRTP